jgi:hypothetical protein
MYDREKMIHNEIEKEINKLINHFNLYDDYFKFLRKEQVDIELTCTTSRLLNDYVLRNKLYDYKVNCNYPNIEIYVQYIKGSKIYEIKPLRFERLKKLRKLNESNR